MSNSSENKSSVGKSKIETTHNVVDHMRKMGEDTSISRPVNFLFISEKKEFASLENDLTLLGFKKIPSNYSEPEKSLLVTKNLDIDSLINTNIISQMLDLANKYLVTFDGWETIPVKKK